MAINVRLRRPLERRLEREASRLRLTKSEFVIDALERALGFKNPAQLLHAVRKAPPMRGRDLSSQVSARMKSKLRAQLPD